MDAPLAGRSRPGTLGSRACSGRGGGSASARCPAPRAPVRAPGAHWRGPYPHLARRCGGREGGTRAQGRPEGLGLAAVSGGRQASSCPASGGRARPRWGRPAPEIDPGARKRLDQGRFIERVRSVGARQPQTPSLSFSTCKAGTVNSSVTGEETEAQGWPRAAGLVCSGAQHVGWEFLP